MTGLGTKGKLGIVFALPEEAVGFERVLAESRSAARMADGSTAWMLGQLEVNAAISGIGGARCAKAVEALIVSGAQWIIAAGFAAALDPAAKVGDIVIAEHILHTGDYPDTYRSDQGILKLLPPHSTNTDFTIRVCDLISTDTVISTPQQKQAIYSSTGAGALDMESFAAARLCSDHGIPFAAIRSISDSASDSINDSIITLVALEKRWRQFLYIAGKPQIWRCILEMRRKTSLAANNLADILGFMLLRII